jgi:hypothetical protein
MGREKHFWTVHANFFVHMFFGYSLRSNMIGSGPIEACDGCTYATTCVSSLIRDYRPCARWRILSLMNDCVRPFLDALSRVNATVRTGEGLLWDSSLLMHRRRSFGRRDCSIRRARQSACSRQHSGLITSSFDAWLTCCWHFASLKLFFWIQAFIHQLRSSLGRLLCLTLDGTCSWMAWRIAFDVLF